MVRNCAPEDLARLAQILVMPGLVPGIHVLGAARQSVDGRDKPGHDVAEIADPTLASRAA
ncbi:hypothetical protein XH96_10040 [Bradyrhizobium sp. CCBAU 51765]|nr:hypothetical protein XH96_10040 [Bradyrhizobium sp. CCBAU 51765]